MSTTTTPSTDTKTIGEHSARSPEESSKSLFLWTAASPNAYKVTILLEELKDAYPGIVDYDYRAIRLGGDHIEQKEEWYLKINPNGKIPALTVSDKTNPNTEPFHIFESAAILAYLVQKHDINHKLSFDLEAEPSAWADAQSWLYFAHSAIGPTWGQAAHFTWADDKIEYAIRRFTDEGKRVLGTFNTRLSGGREYLAGLGAGKFSVVDINAFTWISGVEKMGLVDFNAEGWVGLQTWTERIRARPAVQRGLQVVPRLPGR